MGTAPKAEPAQDDAGDQAAEAPKAEEPAKETAKEQAKVETPADDDREARFDAMVELRHAFGREFVDKEFADLPTTKLVAMAKEYKPRREKIGQDFAKLKQGGYTPASGRDNADPAGSPTSGATQPKVNPAKSADDPEDPFKQLEDLDPETTSKARSAFLTERQKAEQAASEAAKAAERAEAEATRARVFKVQSVTERLKRDFPELDKEDVLREVMKKADKKDPDKAALASAMEGDDADLVELLRFAAESVIPKKKDPVAKKTGSVDVQTRAAGSKALTQDQRDELYFKAAVESGGNQAEADKLLARWTN